MLEEIIRRRVAAQGPLDVGQYMSLALGHPQHGYYMKQDPLGAAGDFTTAPEISQMFACLLETSPALRMRQADAVPDAVWIETLDALPTDRPLILVANEFLDALPFRQFEKTTQGWAERAVTWENGVFCFAHRPAGAFASVMPDAPVGAVFEIAPMRESFVASVRGRLKAQSGAALFIDYGHAHSGLGDTFQAVYKHKPVGVFAHIGDADLTSHVDFGPLGGAVVEQGAFLKALGIERRAASLGGQTETLRRLTHKDEMGELFKVMGISNGIKGKLAGL
jgi:NADH dehydrogenase [ubiquinone] 1 alpha subcomplex assembly factor 7